MTRHQIEPRNSALPKQLGEICSFRAKYLVLVSYDPLCMQSSLNQLRVYCVECMFWHTHDWTAPAGAHTRTHNRSADVHTIQRLPAYLNKHTIHGLPSNWSRRTQCMLVVCQGWTCLSLSQEKLRLTKEYRLTVLKSLAILTYRHGHDVAHEMIVNTYPSFNAKNNNAP